MHKLLAKQIEKARAESGEIDLARLTELVATAYEEAEHDRQRTDRSISLMVEEIDAFQKSLEDKIEQRTAELRDSRRALKLQNKRMAAALDSTGYAISIFDGNKKLVYCNSYFLDPLSSAAAARPARHLVRGNRPGPYRRQLLCRRRSGSLLPRAHRRG